MYRSDGDLGRASSSSPSSAAPSDRPKKSFSTIEALAGKFCGRRLYATGIKTEERDSGDGSEGLLVLSGLQLGEGRYEPLSSEELGSTVVEEGRSPGKIRHS